MGERLEQVGLDLRQRSLQPVSIHLINLSDDSHRIQSGPGDRRTMRRYFDRAVVSLSPRGDRGRGRPLRPRHAARHLVARNAACVARLVRDLRTGPRAWVAHSPRCGGDAALEPAARVRRPGRRHRHRPRPVLGVATPAGVMRTFPADAPNDSRPLGVAFDEHADTPRECCPPRAAGVLASGSSCDGLSLTHPRAAPPTAWQLA